jgi:hypothetical protein
MVLPDWVPPAVKDTATRFTAHYLNSEIELAILRRLATDPRMKQVWTELTRRDRKTGQFFHPVTRSGSLDNRTQEQTQSDEMGRLFHFAFCAARDRVTVTKPSDIEPLRDLCEQRARVLRETADDLEAINSSDPRVSADAATLRRVAAWQDQAIEAMRPLTDPTTVKYHRGDPVARGVQIMIAAYLKDVFGQRLDGVAAILAAVALGQEKTSPRVSRSAFSGRKPPRRS